MSERIPAYEGREPYLFISYAHLDSDKVLPVIEALFADKYRLWYDEGIAPGSEWPKNIEDHLRAAAAVVVFVSDNSLRSPNCENEVVHADAGPRPVIQFTVDGKVHPLLVDSKTVSDAAALRALLEERLIGDGVTGYERGVGTSGRGNFWTGIIAVAVGLIAALGLGIYGLNVGWFDSMLPGLAAQDVTQPVQEELVDTGANILTHSILQQTNAQLTDEIPFESEEAQNCLYDAIGFRDWGQETPMTYENLATCNTDEISLNDPNDEVLTYLQYFPRLKRIRIRGGSISSLEALFRCASLKTVYLTYNTFPVEIPEGASFTVEYMN